MSLFYKKLSLFKQDPIGCVNTLIALRRNYRSYRELDKQALVLNSIPKSGTNWLRLLIVNYVSFSLGRHRLSYDDLLAEFSCREYIATEKIDLATSTMSLAKASGFRHFLYGHSIACLAERRWSKCIFLYRNPLDVLISRFYYSYYYRKNLKRLYTHPSELISEVIPPFVRQYKHMTQIPGIIVVSYEMLRLNTSEEMTRILHSLGFSVDQKALASAIQASSFDATREYERLRGRPLHISENAGFTGNFVRSGEVGQWKEYLGTVACDKVFSIMSRAGVNADNFVWQI